MIFLKDNAVQPTKGKVRFSDHIFHADWACRRSWDDPRWPSVLCARRASRPVGRVVGANLEAGRRGHGTWLLQGADQRHRRPDYERQLLPSRHGLSGIATSANERTEAVWNKVV